MSFFIIKHLWEKRSRSIAIFCASLTIIKCDSWVSDSEALLQAVR